MEALDPSRAEISKFKISTRKKKTTVLPLSFFFSFLGEKLSFSNFLKTLDYDRGPRDFDLSAKMEALDPPRDEISKFKISTRKKNDSVTPFVFFHFWAKNEVSPIFSKLWILIEGHETLT